MTKIRIDQVVVFSHIPESLVHFLTHHGSALVNKVVQPTGRTMT